MKIVMIANIIIRVCFMICVTILSIMFDKTSLLWWFVLTPFLGYEYRSHPTEKGGVTDKYVGGTEKGGEG